MAIEQPYSFVDSCSVWLHVFACIVGFAPHRDHRVSYLRSMGGGKGKGKAGSGRTTVAKPKADAKAKAKAEARLRNNLFSVVFQELSFNLESRI